MYSFLKILSFSFLKWYLVFIVLVNCFLLFFLFQSLKKKENLYKDLNRVEALEQSLRLEISNLKSEIDSTLVDKSNTINRQKIK